VAKLLGVTVADVAITATTGEGLTDFGKGLGVQAFAVLTAEKEWGG
jgi:2-C-methyl-D-erythritol 2,4-cyclodiphosphate synthase